MTPTDPNSVGKTFNPAQAKLNAMQECLEQLRTTLPDSEEAYITADSMTHSVVKSCYLMIIQRAIDVNHKIIEVSGGRPSSHNRLQTFLAVWGVGGIDDDTLSFSQPALEIYQEVVNQDLTSSEMYNAAQDLLKYGDAYVNQIEEYFRRGSEPTESSDREKEPESNGDAVEVSSSVESIEIPFVPPKREKPFIKKELEKVQPTIDANYKGELQSYCHQWNLSIPTYSTMPGGPPNNPSWLVTVRWGDSEFTIPNPIQGSKRNAEQFAAKQVLEQIQSSQVPVEVQPAPPPLPEGAEPEPIIEAEPQESLQDPSPIEAEIPELTRLSVPVELVTTAIGIANHKLAELRRARGHSSVSRSEGNFAEQLAKLTIEIVRAVQKEAEANRVEIQGVTVDEESES